MSGVFLGLVDGCMTGNVSRDGCRNGFMQYIVVDIVLIQMIPRIPGPRVHNPQKFIIFLDKNYKITGKILSFHNFN